MGFFESIEAWFDKSEGWLEAMHENGWIWIIIILAAVLAIVVMFME